MGYHVMLTTDRGNCYGEELGRYQTEYADWIREQTRKYNENRTDNPGRRKYSDQKRRYKERMHSYINHELNRFLETEKPEIIYMAKLPNMGSVLYNTVFIAVLKIIVGMIVPIFVALMLNEIGHKGFKRSVQTSVYFPHFLSWVIFGGIVLEMLMPNGVISATLYELGIIAEPINFMAKGEYFYGIYTLISVIKSVGFGSILYVAAITGIDQELYEAATVDGCGRFQKMWYITVPCISGTIVIMLIFQISSILNTGYEQIILLQNSLNLAFSETLDTYVYKVGIAQSRYSYAAAVGLLKSVMSVMLMLIANQTSKKTLGRGLF